MIIIYVIRVCVKSDSFELLHNYYILENNITVYFIPSTCPYNSASATLVLMPKINFATELQIK